MLDPSDRAQRPALRAWLALQRVLHLDPMAAIRLLEATNDPVAALRRAGRGRPSDAALDAAVEPLVRLGVYALPWASDLYPKTLQSLPDAAPLLLVRGQPGVLHGRAVAVVGARAPTAYGLDAARSIATSLAEAGVVVVSGLARGIDAAAHRAALEAGGLTVAWLACGPDEMYPPEHLGLAEEIAREGAVVTEMPPGTPPLPQYFPLRNRLISGLAEAVVVVEARPRSGSLSTARRALDQGREVLAVPGPIDAPTSRGPNRLLRDGARPVCSPEDVLDAIGLGPPSGSDARGRRAGPKRVDPVGPVGRKLLESLRRSPATRDALAARVGLPLGVLALALVELELAGRVKTDRDGRFRVVGSA